VLYFIGNTPIRHKCFIWVCDCSCQFLVNPRDQTLLLVPMMIAMDAKSLLQNLAIWVKKHRMEMIPYPSKQKELEMQRVCGMDGWSKKNNKRKGEWGTDKKTFKWTGKW
jgi:hypothetical protein